MNEIINWPQAFAQIVCPCCGAVINLICIPSATAQGDDKHEVEEQ